WVKVDSVFFTKSANQWDMPADDIKCYEANPNMLNNLKSVIKAL
ncbi:MAG: aldehyde-activating protein, partial [Flavobacteriaceae bacterium]|nr:aldehyde-activating protein [Flavobacteriaceae bacterium]